MNGPSDYRPITLLPIYSKILEKVLVNQLTSYFEDSKLFSQNQFGFRAKLNTESVTETLLEEIGLTYEGSQYAVCSFMDLSRAFVFHMISY